MDTKKKHLLMKFSWEENYLNLVAFTEWVIQGKSWNSNKLPMGQTAENIVRDVIEKTFSEKRNWDPEKGDLLMWLKWVIRSEVSHLATSYSNKYEVQSDNEGEYEYQEDGHDIRHNKLLQNQQQNDSLEEKVIKEETEEEKSREARLKIDALLEACSGISELEDIVYAIIDCQCGSKAQDLSEYLGRPVNEIYQNLRTLRRRATKIQMEAQNG